MSLSLPTEFNGVCRKISAAWPLDEIFAIADTGELSPLLQRLERLGVGVWGYIKEAGATIGGDNMKYAIILGYDLSYFHWSNPRIGNGFCPFTAKFQSAIRSSW